VRAVRAALLRRRADAKRAALYLVTAVAAGDTLHTVFHGLSIPLPHHAFHLVFSFGAVAVFGAYVAYDVRRHGWPGFSWRL